MLAQIVAGYSLLQILVIVIIVAAAIGITVVVVKWMGLNIPPPVVKVFWILVAAFVGVAALVFLFHLVGQMH
jgi:hypothetical protein